jgi:PAS domain S-box-containing protein
VGVDGRIAYATDAVSRIFGARAETMTGRSITDWTNPDGATRLRALLERCAETAGPLPPEEFQSLSDPRMVVEVVASNQLENPLLGGLVLTCRDVAHRQRLESQLRQSHKMDAVGRLAGGVAHDFNNLLGVIIGYAELLDRDAGDARHVGSRAAQIMKAAGTAADLTRQLLAFSRKQTLLPVVLDLNRLILGMEPLLKRLIGERIEVATVTGAEAATVRADKGQIQQVVMNLAVNARDAMPDGGRLLIETGSSGPDVVLAVTDSGRGMDPVTTARMFEPFFTTKDVGEGTGLGLAAVYGIITQSGGRIDVESEEGRGSTFRIHLPRVVGTPEEKSETENRPRPALLGRTLLLVEDDPGLLELTRELLEDAGYVVVPASHAEEALGLAERGRIDAIVTDVVMPGMTGPEMVARLRAGGVTAKVLYMSGYAFSAIEWQGTIDPGTDFIAKPFRSAALLGKLHEMIEDVVLPPAERAS